MSWPITQQKTAIHQPEGCELCHEIHTLQYRIEVDKWLCYNCWMKFIQAARTVFGRVSYGGDAHV